HCKDYIRMGAEKVVGIDISEKMLEVAKAENSDPKITYLNLAMEDLDQINEEFDLVISSLALHYVEDFEGVLKNINNLLVKDGYFIFSQESPLSTCFSGGDRWTKDENGNKLHLNLTNYGREDEKSSEWFVNDVKRYHRMFSTIVNSLVDAGFSVERMIEPLPNEEILAKYPDYDDLFHKPDFLLVKAKKRA
ncbi:MAG: class I SAM-dependent methyltransferase, partial [Lachnospiraceae bacterium]|nr:class I SAM-dependent methyltransferase [Lachnospiraceae bacterium]